MPMYETTVRTPAGETKDRVFAPNAQEAKKLLEQRHGPECWFLWRVPRRQGLLDAWHLHHRQGGRRSLVGRQWPGRGARVG